MTVDLSAFYFDIRKDALYCDPYSSVTRKACLTVLDHLFRCTVTWLAPMLCFTAEEAWLARDPARRLGPSRAVSRGAGRVARRSAGRQMAQGAQCAPRGDRRARDRTRAQTHRLFARSASDRVCRRRRLFAAVVDVDLAEICITSAARWSKATGPADAFRLADVAGVAVVPRPRRRTQMRALVEDLTGRRPRSAISRRDAARCAGAARMGRHAQSGGVGGGVAEAARGKAGPLHRLGAAERIRSDHRRRYRHPRSSIQAWLLDVFDLADRGRVALTPFLDLIVIWNTGISYGLFQQKGSRRCGRCSPSKLPRWYCYGFGWRGRPRG